MGGGSGEMQTSHWELLIETVGGRPSFAYRISVHTTGRGRTEAQVS